MTIKHYLTTLLMGFLVLPLVAQIGPISDGEAGSSVRTKLNTVITEVNGLGTAATRDVGGSSGNIPTYTTGGLSGGEYFIFDGTLGLQAQPVASIRNDLSLDTLANAETLWSVDILAFNDIGTDLQAWDADLDTYAAGPTAAITAAGALMDSEITNLPAVKTFDPTAYEPAGVVAADITDATADGITLVTSADANPFTDAEQSKLDALTNEQTIVGIQTFTDPIEALAGVNLRNDSDLVLYGGEIFMDNTGRIAIGTKSFNLDGAGEMQLNSHLELHSMTDATDPNDTVVVGYPGSAATGRGPGIKMELATGSYWHAINLGDDFVVRNATGEAMRADTASRVATFPGGYGATERTTDPPNPAEGQHVIWQSTGAGHGAAGDVIIKITNGGTTKTHTLVDFSAITDEQL